MTTRRATGPERARCGIGIDLGGTKICGVALDAETGLVSDPMERPTQRERPAGEIIDAIVATIRDLAVDQAAVIGVGLPTALDESGKLVDCPNLPTMTGARLPAALEGHLGLPVVTENDANCFAYGEWRWGAASGTSVCCGITLGTGFGLGIVIDGCLYRGGHRNAGEIWCAPLPEGRTVEDAVSGDGVVARYQERTGRVIEPAAIAQRARDGESDAVGVWGEYGEALGFALCYTANLLDPEIVVVGGTMAAARDLFDRSMKEVLKRHVYDIRKLKIVPAALGAVAGAVGAAQLAVEKIEPDANTAACRDHGP